MFDNIREIVNSGNIPETPMLVKYNENFVRDRGNYHVLTDMAKELANILGKDAGAIESEMLDGDYNNILVIWAREFSDFVTIQSLTADEVDR